MIKLIPVLFLERFCKPALFYPYVESLLNLIKNMGGNSETLPSATHFDDVDRTNDIDSLVNNSGKWANWRVIMNCAYSPGLIISTIVVLTSSPNSVIIIGLGFGLVGYDNAFASPLVSLPLFVEKYQGLNPTRTAHIHGR